MVIQSKISYLEKREKELEQELQLVRHQLQKQRENLPSQSQHHRGNRATPQRRRRSKSLVLLRL